MHRFRSASLPAASRLPAALCFQLMAVIATATVQAQVPLTTQPRNAAQPIGATPPAYSEGDARLRTVAATAATTNQAPQLRKLPVPPAHASAIATTLSLRYQDLPGVTISPDAANGQLVVMAPAQTLSSIRSDVETLVRGAVRQASSSTTGPLKVRLQNISWREFERDLKQAAGQEVPMTTRNNGNQVAFQMNVTPMQGTVVEIDRRTNEVTVRGPEHALPGWQQMIGALDRIPNRYDDVTQVHRLINADMAPVQRTLRLLRSLRGDDLTPRGGQSVFRNAVMQADQQADPNAQRSPNTQRPANGQVPPNGQPQPDPQAQMDAEALAEGAGPLGDVQIEYVPQLGQIIVKGATRDVRRVMELIKEIEEKAELTQPDSEVVQLQHADSNAVAELLQQLYEDVLSTRQGDVSISALDTPNALLLIGRAEAIASLKELIQKIDQPIDDASRLRVFRLQHASAIDAQDSIVTFFSDRPTVEDELRPGLGPRVRVSADYRTNSLIVSAAPRDMEEVTRLINELDVRQTSATSELKVFPLNNAIAEELAETLTDAFTGDEVTASEETSPPATTLSIVAVDSDEKRIIESGILAGATITADTQSNSIVVRAPSPSMPLIGELIKQLDRAPGIDSLVKVFTIQNGDATQLAAALENLFGAEAATSGTNVGAGNVLGLPPATAGPESSLVPLRFSVDVRTNSIIASGSLEDLEVVESILLRLDSEGFAERITEVIWLKNNDAALVAQAITQYVAQRQQSQTTIQQYQQGLGPFDLLDRDIIAVAEENFNSILLSVTPRLYEEVRSLIDRLDRRRPMVLIKVMLAEVRLEDAFEIGTELGLQDSVVFSRGQAVANVPGTESPGDPGFNFNNAGVPNNNTALREDLLGTAVSTFGLGQSNPAIGYGGFVVNAASESVSLLFRTLQDAGRAQIISRPQLMTTDNTEALINVGRQIARFRGSTVTNNNVTQNIEDITVGLILNIRPRVGSDGSILMEVNVTRSDRDEGNGTVVPDGTGGTVLIEDIVDTTAQAILSVYSGQTVIMGGLIQKSRTNFSRRLPYLSNIPILGNLFKYDFEAEVRSELLIVLTPMLVTGGQDLEYIKQVESSRMSWCLADVVEAHGDVGLSGGYGLWGPAIGPTIYPDITPTVDGPVMLDGDSEHRIDDPNAPIIGPPMNAPVYPESVPPQMDAPTILDDGFDPGVLAPPAVNPVPPPQAAPAVPGGTDQSSFRRPVTKAAFTAGGSAGMIDGGEVNLPAGWLEQAGQ